ncbi:hypothetical protein M5K25_022354 [Dendrobium thyrsiflorum]|uniref:H(+)-transporting two-sector ATPase n=1 Tax=Dendrobium thyrsiflorum TaxID=117978 RepID=A0ABD0UC64_DENTH
MEVVAVVVGGNKEEGRTVQRTRLCLGCAAAVVGLLTHSSYFETVAADLHIHTSDFRTAVAELQRYQTGSQKHQTCPPADLSVAGGEELVQELDQGCGIDSLGDCEPCRLVANVGSLVLRIEEAGSDLLLEELPGSCRLHLPPVIREIKRLEESKVALVYGQMNEPPGARMRVGLTALTMAEYFRDVNEQDVVLFIDNIFHFVQAGSEVSILLGRMPYVVGYQPTLSTKMGSLQERITSTKEGSITSIQAVYVPTDDLTDPAPAMTFAHLDATTMLSRGLAAKDIGLLRIRLNDRWLTVALMGSFARISNNEIIILGNGAEISTDIDPQEAKKTLEIAEANLSRAEGKRQAIEANLALRRARTRVEAVKVISY